MMKWLRKQLGVDALEAQLRAKDEEIAKRDAELAAKQAEIEKLADPEPVEPRIEVISTGMNPDGTTSLQMEWNDEFIQQLRDYGYEGAEDDDVVNLWLSTILVNRPDRVPNGLDRLNHERGTRPNYDETPDADD